MMIENVKALFDSWGLLPFQTEFASRFIQSSEPIMELVSPPGTGKHHLTAALIDYEISTDPNKRILVLSPPPLLLQLEFNLKRLDTVCPVLRVDRKTYLELESSVDVGNSPWPESAIILASPEFAKRDDICRSLCEISWNLIVFDESHLFSGKGQRRALFDKLVRGGAAKRGLLLSGKSSGLLDDTASLKIALSDVVDKEGRPLFEHFEKILTPIYYERNIEERLFLHQLEEFTRRLSNWGKGGAIPQEAILRAASSSLYATEGSLRRLMDVLRPIRNKIVHHVPYTKEDVDRIQSFVRLIVDESEVIEDSKYELPVKDQEFISAFEELDLLLSQIEEIDTDSKLEALMSRVKESHEKHKGRYTCIWASYLGTVQLLSTSLGDFDYPVLSITGSVSPSQRVEILEEFKERRGILIVTNVMSEGISLKFVDECINYDPPPQTWMWEQRWGRFLRIGHDKEFVMSVLRDKTKSLHWEEEAYNSLFE